MGEHRHSLPVLYEPRLFLENVQLDRASLRPTLPTLTRPVTCAWLQVATTDRTDKSGWRSRRWDAAL